MAFSFMVKAGNLQSIVAEMNDIQIKALENGMEIAINREHLLDAEPYILVNCNDKQKGMRLLEQVGRGMPRFSLWQ